MSFEDAPDLNIVGRLKFKWAGTGSSKPSPPCICLHSPPSKRNLTERAEEAMKENKGRSKMNIAIIHPDLGIGGAERLIVDAAVELASHGHNVHIVTSHHDKTHCFEETLNDLLLSQHTTVLRRIYRKPIDFLEEITTGMADLILVNSKFTASTFAKTFKNFDARGIRPAVLYPAVNLDQFSKYASSLGIFYF